MAFIEIKSLLKRFKDVVAVNRIQLDIQKGDAAGTQWVRENDHLALYCRVGEA